MSQGEKYKVTSQSERFKNNIDTRLLHMDVCSFPFSSVLLLLLPENIKKGVYGLPALTQASFYIFSP